MANCCLTSVALYRDTDFTDDEAKAIAEALFEVEHCGGDITYHEGGIIEWEGDTRWNLPTEELKALSEKMHCSIRAIGREDGCAFIQVQCFDDGATVQDQEIAYAR